MSNHTAYSASIVISARELESMKRYGSTLLPPNYFDSPLYRDDIDLRNEVVLRLVEAATLIPAAQPENQPDYVPDPSSNPPDPEHL